MEESKPLSKPNLSTDKLPFIQCLIEFLDTTAGREKFYRLVQYTSKFLVPFTKNRKHLEGMTTFLDNFGNCCGLTRKVLRIGRYFSAIKNVKSRLKETKGCPFTRMVKNIADVSLSLNFLFDHILLINNINSYKFSKETVNLADFLSNFCWLIETLATLVFQSLELITVKEEIIRSKMQLNENTDNMESISLKISKLELEYNKKLIDILRCLTDLPVLLHSLTSDKVVPTWICGAFGMISSVIGCYQKWSNK